MVDGVDIVTTYRVMVPRTPAVQWQKRGGGADHSQETRRKRNRGLRPSSKASREAAASNLTSDGSQPPLGTRWEKDVSDTLQCSEREGDIYKASCLVAFDLSRRALCQQLLRWGWRSTPLAAQLDPSTPMDNVLEVEECFGSQRVVSLG